uniref:dihydropteroate synthase n=1 Tax=Magnetococcus massalia (strain MO-1) TaxID=451514 RepID=A0A1S7LN33_MAGMO|nr:Putative dihydropteroate synthase [Candidatus Magnetococcus massalia]
MQCHGIITPQMGASGAHFFLPSAESQAPHLPWKIRLFPWLEAWDPWLPDSLTISEPSWGRMASGWMTQPTFEAFVQQLFLTPAQPASMALHRAWQQHQASLKPLQLPTTRPQAPKSPPLDRPVVMGIVNTTPDSFSDGGHYHNSHAAIDHALKLADEGADILDIGGESSRPGAQTIPLEEELKRVIPVIREVSKQCNLPISIDTVKAGVMSAALEAGASIINDISALTAENNALQVARESQAPVVLMHRLDSSDVMQEDPRYEDCVAEISYYLEQRIAWCEENGLKASQLIVDPGLGFGKTLDHNLALLRELGAFRGLGCTLLLGLSRKRMVAELSGIKKAADRDLPSHLFAAEGIRNGAHWVRVHDVAGARVMVDSQWRSMLHC